MVRGEWGVVSGVGERGRGKARLGGKLNIREAVQHEKNELCVHLVLTDRKLI